MSAQMLQLTTDDGVELHYHCGGNPDGTPVVFLHGWCANALEWLPFAQAFSDRHRTLCWNARGHGRHPYHDDIDMALDRLATDLHQLLDHCSNQPSVLVGHSMGALIGLRYIQQYGCRNLKGLCLIDQSPKLVTDCDWRLGIYGDFDRQRNQCFLQRLRDDFVETVVGLICARPETAAGALPQSNYVERLRGYLKELPAGLLSRCWQSLSEVDLRPALDHIEVPTLLLYGDRSQFYGPQVARWMASHIPEARLIRYPEADHSPHVSHKQQLTRDLGRFLQRLADLPPLDQVTDSRQHL